MRPLFLFLERLFLFLERDPFIVRQDVGHLPDGFLGTRNQTLNIRISIRAHRHFAVFLDGPFPALHSLGPLTRYALLFLPALEERLSGAVGHGVRNASSLWWNPGERRGR